MQRAIWTPPNPPQTPFWKVFGTLRKEKAGSNGDGLVTVLVGLLKQVAFAWDVCHGSVCRGFGSLKAEKR